MVTDEQTTGLKKLPVDLTKEEFINYHLTIGKRFGSLKMQNPTLVIFGIYLVMIGGFAVSDFVKTGVIPVMTMVMFAITALCGVLMFFLMPMRTKRMAEMLYESGNEKDYYGELTLDNTMIVKDLGTDFVRIPLNDRTMYLETADFMAFSTVGEPRTIILPARCVTEEAAKAIRAIMFAPDCRVSRRVLKRMTAKADAPIERRDNHAEPEIFAVTRVIYEEDEIKKQISDMNWRKFGTSVPLVLVLGVMLGSMLAPEDEMRALMTIGMTVIGVFLGSVVISLIGGKFRIKRSIDITRNTMMSITLTERGVRVRSSAGGRPTVLRWACMKTAVERPSCLEFTGMGQFIRVPKRCIDDVEEWKQIVDRCFDQK
ncbi:MAG: hypothetical protein IKV35_04300 [Clostridia bacterium]|nr:hypothetical protein [Clostridia bacterium]